MADQIPGSDADCLQMLTHAGVYISTNAAALGVSTSRATLLNTQIDSFGSTLGAHLTAQANAQSARAAKDDARGDAVATAREIFNSIYANPAVTDVQIEAIGLRPRDTTRTSVPAPTAVPAVVVKENRPGAVTFHAVDAAEPTRRAKPPHVANWQVFLKVAETAPASVDDCRLAAVSGRSSITLPLAPADAGKTAWLIVRGVNAKGDAGPACEPVSVRLAA